MKAGTRFAFIGAVVAAVTASLCCILPVVAAVAGIIGFAASEFFARWRPYLLGLTLGLLAVGFYLAYRRRGDACEIGTPCERPSLGSWSRVVLWLITILVIGLAAFPYYSGWVARALAKESKPAAATSGNSTARVGLRIEGMDCGACAALLEKNLSQVPWRVARSAGPSGQAGPSRVRSAEG